MAVTPSTGLAEADIYFSIEDETLRDTFRQLYDNFRKMGSEVKILTERVRDLEDREDKTGLT
jgi:hypothetical protein|tara:strand:- start:943 stop:1128 length:186 start_codon:yes stop_codon:yes gene_type:complete